MESLFEQVENGRIWPLTGGVHPPACKENTSGLPIIQMPMPQQLILPLKQHIGEAGELLVKQGDHVYKGQLLTTPVKGLSLPIHAPTSGVVDKIAPNTIPHPSGLSESCIFLTPDGQDTWIERNPVSNFAEETLEYLVDKIKMAGISGLGGAGFPAFVKSASLRSINYLIVNATECEPYITADESLIQRSAEQIIQGIDVIAQIVKPKLILIGIEDDKPSAIKNLQDAISHRQDIAIRVFPAKYPSGGEKQLIKILTGEEVPAGGFPVDIGILVHNIGTLYAIYKAVVCDEPLISRIVTVTGESVGKPQNLEVLLGTPIANLLTFCGFHPVTEQRVIMGGPMMGFTLPHWDVPVVKISNCILAPGKDELPNPIDERECIRCGACADACPVKLLPQQMFWYAKAKDLDKVEQYNIKDCIECGACAYVCPSEIPLVNYYRTAKAEILTEQQEKRQAEIAKERFEARKQRLEREAEERAEKQRIAAEKRKQAMAKSGGSNAVAAALARVKAKKAEKAAIDALNTDDTTAEKPVSPVSVAITRAKEKKRLKELAERSCETQALDSTVPDVAVPVQDKTPVQDDTPTQQTQEAQVVPAQDAKKAVIAAAIAKAKARKLVKQTESKSDHTNSSEDKQTNDF